MYFLNPDKKYGVSLIVKDPNDKNVVNCDENLRRILMGKPQVELAELPALIKLHFPKEPK
jgi:chromatin remodeling complex protein RSC6